VSEGDGTRFAPSPLHELTRLENALTEQRRLNQELVQENVQLRNDMNKLRLAIKEKLKRRRTDH